MAGIVAVSATTDNIGSTSPDQNLSGYVTREQITLSTDPTGSSYRWAITKPSGSARSALSNKNSASPTFTPDVTGYYVISVTVDESTTYVARIAAVETSTTVLGAVNSLPLADATVNTPRTGTTVYHSSDVDEFSWRKADGTTVRLSALGSGSGAQIVADADAIRALTISENSTAVDVATGGFWIATTGNGAGTYTDNTGTILLPTGGDGGDAWLRQYDGQIHADWFEPVGDGSSDDTSALQSAINEAERVGKQVIFDNPSVRYTVTSALTVKNADIRGESELTRVNSTSSTEPVFHIAPAVNNENPRISRMLITGGLYGVLANTAGGAAAVGREARLEDLAIQSQSGVGSAGVKIEDILWIGCEFRNIECFSCGEYGFYVKGPNVLNATGFYNVRAALTDTCGIYLEHTAASNIDTATTFYSSIVENNESTGVYLKCYHVKFIGCHFERNGELDGAPDVVLDTNWVAGVGVNCFCDIDSCYFSTPEPAQSNRRVRFDNNLCVFSASGVTRWFSTDSIDCQNYEAGASVNITHPGRQPVVNNYSARLSQFSANEFRFWQNSFTAGYRESASWDPGTVATGSSASTTVSTNAGASTSSRVDVVASEAIPAGTMLSGHVSSSGVVTVTFLNLSGSNQSPGTLSLEIDVWRP